MVKSVDAEAKLHGFEFQFYFGAGWFSKPSLNLSGNQHPYL